MVKKARIPEVRKLFMFILNIYIEKHLCIRMHRTSNSLLKFGFKNIII